MNASCLGRYDVTDARGGLVIVDKPAGMTSHDVVARIRRLAKTRRVGHAGTLDPMATGVLVIGIDRATRLLTFLVADDKDYLATIRLGQATVTDDAEGDITSNADASGITDEDIKNAVAAHTGSIKQRPSAVSAIKIDGKRSYARVRDGENVELPERDVLVSQFRVDAIRRAGSLVDIDVFTTVSSGTYIRALARDIGAALGVGAHLTMLRRTRSGAMRIDDARTLEDLEANFTYVDLDAAVAAALPTLSVDAQQAALVRNGRRIPSDLADGTTYGVFSDGVALAISTSREGQLVPDVVFT